MNSNTGLKPLKIALIGYGKMGKELEKLAIERGHEIVLIIDDEDDWEEAELSLPDVALEFSSPDSAVNNILKCFAFKLPVVCGTTGWLDQLPLIKQHCSEQNQTFFYGSNFSFSVNIFFEINKLLAKLMNNHPEYTVDIEETHHITKLDTPSGTAIVLANDIIENMEHLENWSKEKTNKSELEIKSVRQGNVTGTHIVTYESSFDKIEIQHTAFSRKGYSLGAIMAAEWLVGKHGFYQMKDLLNFNK